MSARDRTLDSVVEEDELDSLGEPEFVDEPLSSETPVNTEFRRYDDPRLDALTSNAYVLAKDITTSLQLDDTVEDARKKAWNQALSFKDELAESEEENPVFASPEILDLLGGEDRVATFMRFPGDNHMYAVTLRTHRELLDRLEDMPVVPEEAISGDMDIDELDGDWRERYLDNVRDQVVSNNFIVPVYGTKQGIPERIPAASLQTPSSDIVADPGVDIGEYVRGANELEEVNSFSHAAFDVVESPTGYTVLLEIPESGDESWEAEYDGGILEIYEGDEIVYESSLQELDRPVDSIVSEEFRNGVYAVELE